MDTSLLYGKSGGVLNAHILSTMNNVYFNLDKYKWTNFLNKHYIYIFKYINHHHNYHQSL